MSVSWFLLLITLNPGEKYKCLRMIKLNEIPVG